MNDIFQGDWFDRKRYPAKIRDYANGQIMDYKPDSFGVNTGSPGFIRKWQKDARSTGWQNFFVEISHAAIRTIYSFGEIITLLMNFLIWIYEFIFGQSVFDRPNNRQFAMSIVRILGVAEIDLRCCQLSSLYLFSCSG